MLYKFFVVLLLFRGFDALVEEGTSVERRRRAERENDRCFAG